MSVDEQGQASSAPVLSAAFLATVSHGPGVYQMLGKREVLYVGKARDLRKRLSQYAHFKGPAHSKTAVMLSYVEQVEIILTGTEKEALILEASLIKRHRPRYNVILRDDKNYPLIKVSTKEAWPRLSVTRKRVRDGNRYFGPYAFAPAMHATLELLFAHFPLRRCVSLRQRSRPCLNYQMGRCMAPCAGKADAVEYQRRVAAILAILEGKTEELARELEDEMRAAAQALDFEQAALARDRIKALRATTEYQAVAAEHALDQDVFGLHRQDASVGVAILFVRAGQLTGAQHFFFPEPVDEDAAVLAATIMQYYSLERQPPRELLLPFHIEEEELIGERLAELRQGPVSIFCPQRGKRIALMRMAEANAAQMFLEQAKKEAAWKSLSASLAFKLQLSQQPQRIECLDISNLQGKQAVGSLVCFEAGEKSAKDYRHYRIRGKDSPDDYAMMREVLERRMEKGRTDGMLPNMLLLDGGKGQLQVAVEVLARYGLAAAIDLVAIAKEKQDEGEKLFRPGRKNPILLPAHSPALLFLMRVRDEAHRFGLTFHRKLRGKEQLHSALDEVKGIGPERKKQLLATLGSMTALRQASLQELAAIPGIGPQVAAQLHQYAHPEEHESR